MFAAIETAVPLPYLSLISLVTRSQTSCLREDITTLAPCSAIRSAMARPMPFVEPVMTATFPFISNKVMGFSRLRDVECAAVGFGAKQSLQISTTEASCELGFRHDFRSGRLMHRRMRGIR